MLVRLTCEGIHHGASGFGRDFWGAEQVPLRLIKEILLSYRRFRPDTATGLVLLAMAGWLL
jgi:hypothetical protein